MTTIDGKPVRPGDRLLWKARVPRWKRALRKMRLMRPEQNGVWTVSWGSPDEARDD